MSQSSVIAFFLLAGFVVFITMRGELPSYAGVIGIGSQASASNQTTTPASSTDYLATAGAMLKAILP